MKSITSSAGRSRAIIFGTFKFWCGRCPEMPSIPQVYFGSHYIPHGHSRNVPNISPPHKLRNRITKMRPAAHFCDLIWGKAEFSAPPTPQFKKSNHKNAPAGAFLWFDFGKSWILGTPPPQPRVGDDNGDGDGDGRIFPEHPSPILHAPRDIISRKGKSLTPI